MAKNTIIQLKGGTLNNWNIVNPVLQEREFGLVLDDNNNTINIKIGNGTSHFSELPYYNPGNANVSMLSSSVINIESDIVDIKTDISQQQKDLTKYYQELSENISKHEFLTTVIKSTPDILKYTSAVKINNNISSFLYEITVDANNILLGNNATTNTVNSSNNTTALKNNILIGNNINIDTNKTESIETNNIVIGKNNVIQSNDEEPPVNNIAIGINANVSAKNAIQIGAGTNTTNNSFSINNINLVTNTNDTNDAKLNRKIFENTLLEVSDNKTFGSNSTVLNLNTSTSVSSSYSIYALSADNFTENAKTIITDEITSRINAIDIRTTDNEHKANIAVGSTSWLTDDESISAGRNNITIGYSTNAGNVSSMNNIAIGYNASINGDVSSAIQLGEGTLTTSNTLQVFDQPIIDAVYNNENNNVEYYKLNNTFLLNSVKGIVFEDMHVAVSDFATSATTADNAIKFGGYSYEAAKTDILTNIKATDQNAAVQLGKVDVVDTSTNPLNIGGNNTIAIGNAKVIANAGAETYNNFISIGQNNTFSGNAVKSATNENPSIAIGNNIHMSNANSIQLGGSGNTAEANAFKVFSTVLLRKNKNENTTNEYIIPSSLIEESFPGVEQITVPDATITNIDGLSSITGKDDCESSITNIKLIETVSAEHDDVIINNTLTLDGNEIKCQDGVLIAGSNGAITVSEQLPTAVIRATDLINHLDTTTINSAISAKCLTQDENIFVGINSIASGNDSIAIGTNAITDVSAIGSIAIGNFATAEFPRTIQLGNNNISADVSSVEMHSSDTYKTLKFYDIDLVKTYSESAEITIEQPESEDQDPEQEESEEIKQTIYTDYSYISPNLITNLAKINQEDERIVKLLETKLPIYATKAIDAEMLIDTTDDNYTRKTVQNIKDETLSAAPIVLTSEDNMLATNENINNGILVNIGNVSAESNKYNIIKLQSNVSNNNFSGANTLLNIKNTSDQTNIGININDTVTTIGNINDKANTYSNTVVLGNFADSTTSNTTSTKDTRDNIIVLGKFPSESQISSYSLYFNGEVIAYVDNNEVKFNSDIANKSVVTYPVSASNETDNNYVYVGYSSNLLGVNDSIVLGNNITSLNSGDIIIGNTSNTNYNVTNINYVYINFKKPEDEFQPILTKLDTDIIKNNLSVEYVNNIGAPSGNYNIIWQLNTDNTTGDIFHDETTDLCWEAYKKDDKILYYYSYKLNTIYNSNHSQIETDDETGEEIRWYELSSVNSVVITMLSAVSNTITLPVVDNIIYENIRSDNIDINILENSVTACLSEFNDEDINIAHYSRLELNNSQDIYNNSLSTVSCLTIPQNYVYIESLSYFTGLKKLIVGHSVQSLVTEDEDGKYSFTEYFGCNRNLWGLLSLQNIETVICADGEITINHTDDTIDVVKSYNYRREEQYEDVEVYSNYVSSYTEITYNAFNNAIESISSVSNIDEATIIEASSNSVLEMYSKKSNMLNYIVSSDSNITYSDVAKSPLYITSYDAGVALINNNNNGSNIIIGNNTKLVGKNTLAINLDNTTREVSSVADAVFVNDTCIIEKSSHDTYIINSNTLVNSLTEISSYTELIDNYTAPVYSFFDVSKSVSSTYSTSADNTVYALSSEYANASENAKNAENILVDEENNTYKPISYIINELPIAKNDTSIIVSDNATSIVSADVADSIININSKADNSPEVKTDNSIILANDVNSTDLTNSIAITNNINTVSDNSIILAKLKTNTAESNEINVNNTILIGNIETNKAYNNGIYINNSDDNLDDNSNLISIKTNTSKIEVGSITTDNNTNTHTIDINVGDSTTSAKIYVTPNAFNVNNQQILSFSDDTVELSAELISNKVKTTDNKILISDNNASYNNINDNKSTIVIGNNNISAYSDSNTVSTIAIGNNINNSGLFTEINANNPGNLSSIISLGFNGVSTTADGSVSKNSLSSMFNVTNYNSPKEILTFNDKILAFTDIYNNLYFNGKVANNTENLSAAYAVSSDITYNLSDTCKTNLQNDLKYNISEITVSNGDKTVLNIGENINHVIIGNGLNASINDIKSKLLSNSQMTNYISLGQINSEISCTDNESARFSVFDIPIVQSIKSTADNDSPIIITKLSDNICKSTGIGYQHIGTNLFGGNLAFLDSEISAISNSYISLNNNSSYKDTVSSYNITNSTILGNNTSITNNTTTDSIINNSTILCNKTNFSTNSIYDSVIITNGIESGQSSYSNDISSSVLIGNNITLSGPINNTVWLLDSTTEEPTLNIGKLNIISNGRINYDLITTSYTGKIDDNNESDVIFNVTNNTIDIITKLQLSQSSNIDNLSNINNNFTITLPANVISSSDNLTILNSMCEISPTEADELSAMTNTAIKCSAAINVNNNNNKQVQCSYYISNYNSRFGQYISFNIKLLIKESDNNLTT